MTRSALGLIITFALLIPFASFSPAAQEPANVPRVGILMPVSAQAATANLEAFAQRLRELGYHEGQNIVIERRYAEGRNERLPDLANELVRLKMNVIVTWGTPVTEAVKHATSTIPIVMAAATDPVETGLIASLARPGGNVTGVTSGEVLTGKQLELLKELAPSATRVAVLWNPDNPAHHVSLEQTKAAAQALGLHLQVLGVREAGGLDQAFSAMTRERPDALMTFVDHLTLTHRQRIAAFAAQHRLPAMYGRREYVEVGGLISYGVDFRDNFRRAALFVDKILKGATPADLPVELPVKFQLVLNLKTAQALGLMIPPHILVWADEVIQ